MSVKCTRVRARNRLSAIKVSRLKVPGLYEDGAGLRLVVTDKGTKRWTLRITIGGRRVERGLGLWPTVSLEAARQEAEVFRRAARVGRDARLDMRAASEREAVDFKQAFDDFFAIRREHLSNRKHQQQWQNTLQDYVFPRIGDRPVAEISGADVIAVLKPIWFAKPETASRVLQRMKVTFDSAILRGTREKANPCVGVSQELGTHHRTVRHHAALHWQDVPVFFRNLRERPMRALTRLAFEFLILTAARSGEVRGALWVEIDLAKRVWTIPGNDPATGRRMKSGREHVVPLSDQVLSVLAEAKAVQVCPLLFPGSKGQALSDNTLSKQMRDAGVAGTPHGFRSAFKDWAAESGVDDAVSEATLAHTDKNVVRAAYRRTTFLDERVGLMQRWADFVSTQLK